MISVVVSESENGKYAIIFSVHSLEMEWTIRRSLEDIKQFHEVLMGNNEIPSALLPVDQPDNITVENIQIFLLEALRTFNFTPWDSSIAREFFADGDLPPFVKVEVRVMKNEISFLSQKNIDLEQRLHQLEIMMSKYHSVFHSLADGKGESIRPQLMMSSLSIDSFDLPAGDRRRGFSYDRQNSGSSRGHNDDAPPHPIPPAAVPSEPKLPPVISEAAWNELMTEYPICKDFEREAEDIVRSVQPRDAQFRFRNSAANMMKDQITKALNSNAFDLSFYGLKCFLPDDPIKLTVILNHTTIATWHKVLYDRLIIVSEHQTDRSEQIEQQNSVKFRELLPDEEDDRSHKIKDVRLTSDSNTFKVLGMIDSIPFEIVANSRVELCMLTFFEEINALVGNDHLFKRSVLLIRSWWMYETAAMTEKSLKEYLPDFAIWLMVTAVFNEHYGIITSPIQALYLFLSIYCHYDGSTQAITLNGMRTFLPNSSNLPIDHNYQNYLINQKLFEKYYQVVNIQNTAALQEFTHSKHVKVDRCGFNVIHPFTFVSMTLEKLSSRKTEKILNCFKTASNAMRELFRSSKLESNSTLNLSFKAVLFSETIKKIYAINWRPDSLSNTATTVSMDEMEMLRSPRDVFDVQIGELWHHIFYCNFILEAVVSESALLSLCTEVLTEKKILPVGEVGKTLSDVTAIPNLSSQLREKFGGLKKFLERYPEIFIFSKDHPFNPNVVLRKSLTTDQIDQVERGVVSLQAIFKNMTGQKQQQALSKKVPKITQPILNNISNSVGNSTTSTSSNLPANFQENFQRNNATSNVLNMNNNSNVNNNSNNNVGNLNAISAQLSAASSIPDDRGFNSANLSMHNNMTRTTPTNASTLNMESNRRGASNWTPFLESLNANNIGDWNTASSPETNSTSGLNGTAFWNNNDFPNMEAERNKGFDEHSHNSLNSMNSQTDSWPSFSRGNTNSFPGNSSNYSSDNRMPSNNAFDLSKRGAIRLGGPSTNSLGVILKSQQQSQQPQQRPHSWEVGYGSAYRPMEHSSNTLYTEYGQPNPESHMYGQTSRQPINSMKGKANMQANAYSNPSGASAGYNNGHNPLFANDANAMSSDPASHYHLQQSNNPNNNYNRKYHDWNT